MNTTDTIKAKLTPGEYVIRKEAVDMIGVPMLEKLNNMPEEGGGHSAIDRLIQMATLQNMKSMDHGGEVTTDYASDMQGYENGGQAELDIRRNTPNLRPSSHMRYKRVEGAPMRGDPLFDDRRALTDMIIERGESPNWYGSGESQFTGKPLSIDWKDYVESGQGNVRDEMLLERLLRSESGSARIYDKGKADIDNLNFLAKQGIQLDEEETQAPVQRLMDALSGEKSLLNNIRRTSSYWTPEGREKRKSAYEAAGMKDGGLAGYQNGGKTYSQTLNYTPLENNLLEETEPGLFDAGAIHSISADQVGGGDGRRYYLGEGQSRSMNMARRIASMMARQKMASTPADSIPAASVESYFDREPEKRGFIKKLLGMANGGEVPGYQDGGQPQQDDAMMQQYSQQQQPSNIAPPGAAAGDTMSWGAPGAYMQSIMAERDSLDLQDKEMVRQKAINAIQRLRLDALSGQSMQNDDMEISSDAMERHYSRPSPMETSQSRNESEYLKHQMLQRSPESVLQGIMQPNDTRGMYR